MNRPRGTLRPTSFKEVENPRKAKAVNNGYDSTISTHVQALIGDWEYSQVEDFLAMGNYDHQIKFYWLVKNMLGSLVEEILTN